MNTKKANRNHAIVLAIIISMLLYFPINIHSVHSEGTKVLVANDLNLGSIGSSFQSNLAYVNEVVCYFYIDPSSTGKLYVKTSIDNGDTWGSAVLVDEDSNLGMGGIDVDFVNNTVFCGYGDDTQRRYYFIKGTVASNGVISFGTPDIVYDSAGNSAQSIDVGYSYFDNKYYYASGMDTASSVYRYLVYTSSDGDSWTKIGEIDGTPNQNERYWTPYLVPHHFDNDIYVIYGEYFYGYDEWMVYDGASWGSQTSITPIDSYYMTSSGASKVKDDVECMAMSNEISAYHYVALIYWGEKYIGPNYVYGTHLQIFNSVTHAQTDSENIDINDADNVSQYPVVCYNSEDNMFWLGWIDDNIIHARPYFITNSSLGTEIHPFGDSFTSPTNLHFAKNMTEGFGMSWKETGVDLYFGAYQIPSLEPPPEPPQVYIDPIITFTINAGMMLGGLVMFGIPLIVIVYKGRERELDMRTLVILLCVMVLGFGILLGMGDLI